jgi:hypothetical protein
VILAMSDFPPQSPGQPPPSPSVSRSGILSARTVLICAIVVAVIGALTFYGYYAQRGRSYAAGPLETINYSGDVTQVDAAMLGNYLKQVGYFNGQQRADVLLTKTSGEGTVLSFVVADGVWENPQIVVVLRSVATGAADYVGGKPLTYRLVDSKLNVKHEETIK